MDIYILRDGKQIGPFSEETTHQMLKQGVVYINDPAWRPHMTEWIPLHSVLYPAPPEAAPASAASHQPLPTRPAEPVATERQKAFLRYMGLPFSASLTEEQAAALVNNTMENPKNATRVLRWNDERLKLHPGLFAAEIQAKKEERPQRFHELCETEGAEVMEGVTKAHCKVLVGYLDEKFPQWDAGTERDATWNYFFPAVAEKFPQFVRQDWKSKLQYPQNTKIVPVAKGRKAAVPVRASYQKQKPSSPLASLFKGLAFGLLIVALGVGGLYVSKNPEVIAKAKDQLAQIQAKYSKKIPPAAQTPNTQPSPEKETPSMSSDPVAKAPQAAPESMPVKPMGEAEQPAGSPTEMAGTAQNDQGMMASSPAPELPEAGTAPAPSSTGVSLFDPTPSSGGSTMAGEPSTGGLPAPKTTVTLMQPMELQLTYGKIKVPAGTQLPIVEQDGANLKVRFQNQVIEVPVAATDLGGNGIAQ